MFRRKIYKRKRKFERKNNQNYKINKKISSFKIIEKI